MFLERVKYRVSSKVYISRPSILQEYYISRPSNLQEYVLSTVFIVPLIGMVITRVCIICECGEQEYVLLELRCELPEYVSFVDMVMYKGMYYLN